MKKANLSEQTMISIIWTSLMSSVEWNKKEELVTEQAIKHLKVGAGRAFMCSASIQESCLFPEILLEIGLGSGFTQDGSKLCSLNLPEVLLLLTSLHPAVNQLSP